MLESDANSAPDGNASAEAASTQKVLRALDKASRAARTYGLENPMTARFLAQLSDEFAAHLADFSELAVIVERAELRQHGEVVYRSEDSVGEGLAFRLYGDGIRELRFAQDLSADDLRAFVAALWGLGGREDEEDEDVVTRLWALDLPCIQFVTAEDIVRAPWELDDAARTDAGFFAPPPSSFREVVEREQRAAAAAPAAEKPAAAGVVGFEITPGEQEAIDRERKTESASSPERYVLSALRAILASERSPEVIGRALGLFPGILDVLISSGHWDALAEVLAMLERTGLGGGTLDPAHTLIAARIGYSINIAERLVLLEQGLRADPQAKVSALMPLLRRLGPPAAGPLVQVLATAESAEHRALLRDTLVRVAARNAEPVLRALSDPRPRLVRDLIAVIVAWGQPQAADVLSMLATSADADVRRDAALGIARVRPSGDGAPLVAFASDPDRGVRLHALRALASGHYSAPWEVWKDHLIADELLELPVLDKRTLFHAVRATAGDAAVPFWLSLLVGRGWKQREQREETALVVVDVLELLGSPQALQALELAAREAPAQVRARAASAAAAIARRKEDAA